MLAPFRLSGGYRHPTADVKDPRGRIDATNVYEPGEGAKVVAHGVVLSRSEPAAAQPGDAADRHGVKP